MPAPTPRRLHSPARRPARPAAAVVCAAGLVLAAGAGAQPAPLPQQRPPVPPPRVPEAQEAERAIRVDVRLVLLTARVSPSAEGAAPPGREAFRVFEDGREQPLALFLAQDDPLHVAVAVDTSVSTAALLPMLKQAAARFVESFGAQDRLALYDVSVETVRVAGYDAPRPALLRALGRLRTLSGTKSASRGVTGARLLGAPGERMAGTVLYDALGHIEDDFPAGAQRRAILFFTDAMDTGSATPFEQTERRMLRGHTAIYAVTPVRPGRVAAAGKPVPPGADKRWAVVLDTSAADEAAAARIQQTARAFLGELAPQARVWLFTYRSRRQFEQLAGGAAHPAEPVPPGEALRMLEGGAQVLPARPTVRRLRPERVVVFSDTRRSGVREIFYSLRASWGTYALLAPELFPGEEARAAVLRTLAGEADGPRRAEFAAYEFYAAEVAGRFRTLAADTGGATIEVRSAEELEPAYASIAAQIRSSYTLGYYTRAGPGRYALRVEAAGHGAVLCRRVLLVEP